LATAGNVSASTQNQAMHAVLYLYEHVLGVDLPWLDGITRARESKRIPVVLTVRETQALLRHTHGTAGTIIKLLYGTGMRLMEGLRLRIKDLDLERREIIVREGKGNKDRVTMIPASLIDELQDHLKARRVMHDTDLSTGHADVGLPFAIGRKYPQAGKQWPWQYVFAAATWAALAADALAMDEPARQTVRQLVADTFERIVVYARGFTPAERNTIGLVLVAKGGGSRALIIDRRSGAWRAGVDLFE
ncbi:MAG TPA: tyrosine-type recombinase/integrase, partial [Denitromonas sp.]|nr:tyrosine-type recombinase/integrase [Denitromonas sp.]